MRLLAQNKDWKKIITLKRKLVTTQVRPGNCKQRRSQLERSIKEVQLLVAVQRNLAVEMTAVNARLTTARNCSGVSQLPQGQTEQPLCCMPWAACGWMTVWGPMSRELAHMCRCDPCCTGLAVEGRSTDALKTSYRRDVQLGRVVLVTDIFLSVMGVPLTWDRGCGCNSNFLESTTESCSEMCRSILIFRKWLSWWSICWVAGIATKCIESLIAAKLHHATKLNHFYPDFV